MTVRAATYGDVGRILELAKKFWALTAYEVPFDEDSTADMVNACMGHNLMWVLDIDGRVEGMVAGLRAPCIVNAAYSMGCELAFWVEPDHRQGGHALKLLDAIEEAATAAGIHYWSMIALERLNPEAVGRMYVTRDYRRVEHTYTKKLN